MVMLLTGNQHGFTMWRSAALLRQAHPDWSVEDIKAALMNTAVELTDPYTGASYPHNTQGAGSIRVDKAIETKTLVTPGSYSYGVFNKAKGKQVEQFRFTIKNLSNKRVKYTMDVEFPAGIKVTHSNNLNVGPGKSQQVKMNVQVNASALAPGYYEGAITLKGDNEEIRVPAILFVGEPDYPLLGGAGLADLGIDIIELYCPAVPMQWPGSVYSQHRACCRINCRL